MLYRFISCYSGVYSIENRLLDQIDHEIRNREQPNNFLLMGIEWVEKKPNINPTRHEKLRYIRYDTIHNTTYA